MNIKQYFRSKEKFVNYMQFIPITFGVIWIVLLFYIAYEAPIHPDEAKGRIYPVTVKSRTAYLTLIEEILICGSAIAAPVSVLALILISSHYWKDSDEKE